MGITKIGTVLPATSGGASPAADAGAPVSSPFRVRDQSGPVLTEIWLVSAVVCILGIRLYLQLTGYPQVGGAKLHIAHMLWGGLGMVIAFGMLLIFASDVWKPVAAVVGGAGFGCFIDELGKFITKDNDYFYRPTIGLIYAILVALFLISRSIDKVDKVTAGDHLFYAVQSLELLATGRLDHEHQQAALRHLDAAKYPSPLADSVRQALETAEVVESASPPLIMRWRHTFAAWYWNLVSTDWLWRVVILIFLARIAQIVGMLALGVWTGDFTFGNGLSFSEWGALISGFVAGVLATYGLVRLYQQQRLRGLKALADSTLISLLFGQFFAFTSDQFAAISTLVVELIILGVLRFWIASEHRRESGNTTLAASEGKATASGVTAR